MNTKRQYVTLVLVGVLVLGIAAFLFAKTAYSPTVPLVPEETTSFQFEVVDTEALRAQGLSGRTEVSPGQGMLFIFEEADTYGFWMKDMLISIDIIWLADDGTILGIEKNVSPDTYPEAFYPPQPVRYVLETRPGESDAQGWGVGSRVPIPN